MRVLHVQVERSDTWLVAQALEEPGVITQGRTLDELVKNLRDAAALMLSNQDFHLELLIPSTASLGTGKHNSGKHRLRQQRPKRRAGRAVV